MIWWGDSAPYVSHNEKESFTLTGTSFFVWSLPTGGKRALNSTRPTELRRFELGSTFCQCFGDWENSQQKSELDEVSKCEVWKALFSTIFSTAGEEKDGGYERMMDIWSAMILIL